MPPAFISLIIGVCAALVLTFSNGDDASMSQSEIIAIVVALFGVAGALLAQLYQFKKDSNTIGSVKSDTTGMVPVLNSIEKNTDKLRDKVIEQIAPELQQHHRDSQKMSDEVSLLVDELNYQKRIRAESSGQNRDVVVAEIDGVYRENAALKEQLDEQIRENHRLRLENELLHSQLRQWERDADAQR